MDSNCNTDCEALGEEPHGVQPVGTLPADDCTVALTSSTSYPATPIAASSSSARIRSGSPTNAINLSSLAGTNAELNHILGLIGSNNDLVKIIPALNGRVIIQKDDTSFKIVSGQINNLVQLRTELNPDFVLGAYKNRNVCDDDGCPCFERIRFVKIPVETEPVTPIVAADDSIETDYMTPVNIAVLANDSGDTITILSVTENPCLTIDVEMDGTITVTPLEGCEGPQTFDYTITDVNDQTDTATVTVTVAEAPVEEPVAPSCYSGDVIYHFDASLLSGTDGDGISLWEDQSANAYDVSQAAPTKRPLLRVADRNGLNTIEFDGIDDSLVGPSLTASYISSRASLFAVLQWDSTQSGTALSRRASSNRVELIQFVTSTNNTYVALGEILVATTHTDGSNWVLVKAYTQNDPSLPDFEYSINGTLKQSVASYAEMGSTAAVLRIGHRNHGFGEEDFFKGKIGEIIVVANYDSGCLSEWETYLKEKWGFTY
jgi:hypothetical protein